MNADCFNFRQTYRVYETRNYQVTRGEIALRNNVFCFQIVQYIYE